MVTVQAPVNKQCGQVAMPDPWESLNIFPKTLTSQSFQLGYEQTQTWLPYVTSHSL